MEWCCRDFDFAVAVAAIVVSAVAVVTLFWWFEDAVSTERESGNDWIERCWEFWCGGDEGWGLCTGVAAVVVVLGVAVVTLFSTSVVDDAISAVWHCTVCTAEVWSVGVGKAVVTFFSEGEDGVSADRRGVGFECACIVTTIVVVGVTVITLFFVLENAVSADWSCCATGVFLGVGVGWLVVSGGCGVVGGNAGFCLAYRVASVVVSDVTIITLFEGLVDEAVAAGE